MGTTRVTLPQLGESVHEGTISKWLVGPGDRVVEFEPMVEVDTDKVNTEVPSPVTGTLTEILAQEGETVSAGAEIAVVELEAGVEAPDRVALRPEDAVPVQEAGRPQQGARPEKGGDVEPSEDRQAPAARVSPEAGAQRGEHRYSPGVLMLAQEHGVDLSKVKGTGLAGRVTKRDVRQFIEQGGRAEAPPAEVGAAEAPPPPAEPARPAPPAAAAGPEDRAVPLTRIRKLIADNMSRSKATIPHAWQTQEVDMSGVVTNRNVNKAAFQDREGFSLTYLPYVIAAAVASLREHPEVNATFNETEVIVHRSINLGVSVAAEDVLLVPVIPRADGLSIAGIARAVNDLATRARSRKLKPDELQGGTFTVNNSGTFGTLFSYSVINPGQAGILTMEAIVERPVAVSGMIAIKPMMYLCFSFDHRVLDGLQAARFLTACRKWLEAVAAETPVY